MKQTLIDDWSTKLQPAEPVGATCRFELTRYQPTPFSTAVKNVWKSTVCKHFTSLERSVKLAQGNYQRVGDAAPSGMEEWPQTDQEDRVLKVLQTLDKLLKKAERIKDPNKLHNALKSISEKLKEAKA